MVPMLMKKLIMEKIRLFCVSSYNFFLKYILSLIRRTNLKISKKEVILFIGIILVLKIIRFFMYLNLFKKKRVTVKNLKTKRS